MELLLPSQLRLMQAITAASSSVPSPLFVCVLLCARPAACLLSAARILYPRCTCGGETDTWTSPSCRRRNFIPLLIVFLPLQRSDFMSSTHTHTHAPTRAREARTRAVGGSGSGSRAAIRGNASGAVAEAGRDQFVSAPAKKTVLV